jgi:hypothetical protein
MLGTDEVDEELQRGFGLSINELEPLLRVGGGTAEMKFMKCCRYLWQANVSRVAAPHLCQPRGCRVPALHTIYGRVAEFEREMPRYLSQL